MKMTERKMESYMYAILSTLSLIRISKCQVLLTSSETLKEVNRETDVLRAINVHLQEEIRKKDARLNILEGDDKYGQDPLPPYGKKQPPIPIKKGDKVPKKREVNKLQSRITSLEMSKESTFSKVSDVEQWISGQKTGYRRLVRLVNGGSSYGRLEVNIDGYGWGNVCDDDFTSTEATVVCRQLGYTTGVAKTEAYYGHGTLAILMDDVDCTGTENAIHNCRYVGKDKHNCDHTEDVGVSCS